MRTLNVDFGGGGSRLLSFVDDEDDGEDRVDRSSFDATDDEPNVVDVDISKRSKCFEGFLFVLIMFGLM